MSDYYKLLDIPENASLEEIKKAYRKKARLYHPDINHDSNAMEKFISITEAYDFLMENLEKEKMDEEEYFRIVEEWRKFRQERSRQRAQYYARKSYSNFKNSKYYRSTRILNASSVIFNFAIALMVLIFTILGYIIRLNDPLPNDDNPPIYSFILLLTVSIILLVVSFLYLKAYLKTTRRYKRKP